MVENQTTDSDPGNLCAFLETRQLLKIYLFVLSVVDFLVKQWIFGYSKRKELNITDLVKHWPPNALNHCGNQKNLLLENFPVKSSFVQGLHSNEERPSWIQVQSFSPPDVGHARPWKYGLRRSLSYDFHVYHGEVYNVRILLNKIHILLQIKKN